MALLRHILSLASSHSTRWRISLQGENNMKTTLIRIILATLLLVACGSTTLLADGSDPRPPFCFPGTNCQLSTVLQDGGSPRPPFCFPGTNCTLSPVLHDGSSPRPPFCFPATDCRQP